MFSINEFVIHPTGGICKVTDIAPLEINGADKEKKYYFLASLRNNGGKVYVPVASGDGVIRKVMSDSEAWELIDEIPEIEEAVIDNEKLRENCYKEAIKSCDCRELVKILKNLRSRKEQRLAQGKKNTATDEKYYKIAEDNLFSELAFAIGRDKCEIASVITQRTVNHANEL